MFIFGAILRWAVLAGYLASATLYAFPLLNASVRGERWRRPGLATGILTVTALMHGALFLEMGLEFGRLHYLRSALSAASLCALGLALATMVLEARLRNGSFGAFAVPIATVLYVLSLLDRPSHAGIDPLLDSYWFEVHVTSALLGYAAFGLASVCGMMYLALAGSIRSHRLGALFDRLPSLELLDRIGSRAALVGFVLFTLGLITGAIWSGTATGRLVSGEPKELLALLTWALFALQILLRWRAGWSGRRTALLSILGFVASMMTILGGGSGRHPL